MYGSMLQNGRNRRSFIYAVGDRDNFLGAVALRAGKKVEYDHQHENNKFS
jgi:hypothetical protein